MYEADDEKICSSPEQINRPEAAAAATADPGDAATSGERASECRCRNSRHEGRRNAVGTTIRSPGTGHFQLALNDSLAFAPTGENSTASPQLDEPAWPPVLLIVCKTEPEDVDDDVTRGTS